ncbi:MAG TPA: hypothetical protein VD931_17190, partial [Baekduia sp.]|nr:hypothetical protein [Baekduia sp.]
MLLVLRVLITVVLSAAVVAGGALVTFILAVVVQGGLECDPSCREEPALLVMLTGLAASVAGGVGTGR